MYFCNMDGIFFCDLWLSDEWIVTPTVFKGRLLKFILHDCFFTKIVNYWGILLISISYEKHRFKRNMLSLDRTNYQKSFDEVYKELIKNTNNQHNKRG